MPAFKATKQWAVVNTYTEMHSLIYIFLLNQTRNQPLKLPKFLVTLRCNRRLGFYRLVALKLRTASMSTELVSVISCNRTLNTFRLRSIWIQCVLGSNTASVGEGMFHLGISPQSHNLLLPSRWATLAMLNCIVAIGCFTWPETNFHMHVQSTLPQAELSTVILSFFPVCDEPSINPLLSCRY